MSIKREQLISDIEAMGFVYSHTSGSHMIYKHANGARPIGICHNSKNKVFGNTAYKQVIKEARMSLEMGKQLKTNRGA